MDSHVRQIWNLCHQYQINNYDHGIFHHLDQPTQLHRVKYPSCPTKSMEKENVQTSFVEYIHSNPK